ncbi:hypothetical protein U0E23_09580 [Burkholderia stagnalis]|uniref:hypothetical protein n=1 Tax=Burkholderia stagnalis TaxID=1503054 RepID=UPI002AB586E5|nr:hypothetical protein [Burkholderia stagnalis]MDY7802717.1 hypothetical protein [Burkholderia stagnalis]
MNSWVIAALVGVALYLVVRVLRRATARPATATSFPDAGDTAAAPEPHPPSVPAAAPEWKLADQPEIASIDRVELMATVSIPARQRDMTAMLVERGALDRHVRDANERLLPESTNLVISVPLRKIPIDLIPALAENPVDNLQISAYVSWGERGYIHGAYGNIAHLEQAFAAWLDAPPGWQGVAQERGAFIEGTFFTGDVLLHVERGYMDSSVSVDVVSREALRRDVRRQLAELRAHLQASPARETDG